MSRVLAPGNLVFKGWWDKSEDAENPPYRFDVHINDKNVGYLTTHPLADGVRFDGLAVLHGYRGYGLATALVTRALWHYSGQKIGLCACPYKDDYRPTTALSADRLERFYAGFGFVAVSGVLGMRHMELVAEHNNTARLTAVRTFYSMFGRPPLDASGKISIETAIAAIEAFTGRPAAMTETES